MSDPSLPLTSSSLSGARIARWCALCYAALIVLGVIVFQLPGATIRGNEMSFERSVFTVVNAATLTGFQQAVALDQYGVSGQICVIVLTIAGTLLSLMIGGIALNRALRLDSSDVQVVWATLFTFVFCIGLGTALLLDRGRELIDSATQACSALGNSGLYLGRLPGIMDWRTHAALLPLAIVGGLGVPVLQELFDVLLRRRKLSKHTLIVLAWLAGIYLIGMLVLSPWGLRGTDGNLDLATTITTGSTLSINARTCGLPLASTANVARAGQWVLIVLMSIGAAPAGVAGGMKVTALYHAWRGTRRALRGEAGLRITGIAATWIFAYVAIVFLTLLALIVSLPEMAADRLLFLASSAVANAGLSQEPLALTGGGLWAMVIAMLLGRAAPLLVIWWVATTTRDVDVAVG